MANTTANPTRLTKRGRNLVRGAAVASLLVVIGAGFSAVGNASEKTIDATPASTGYVKVVVAPGETLWSLATMVAGDRSVSSVEDAIVTANNLTGPDLTAGTRLWVPTR
jgi:hypothetical protein